MCAQNAKATSGCMLITRWWEKKTRKTLVTCFLDFLVHIALSEEMFNNHGVLLNS